MRILDEHEIATTGEIACAVLGRGAEFELVDLSLDDDEIRRITAHATGRGFCYCGTVAVRDGEAVAACAPGLEAVFTMMHAGMEFARLVSDRIRQKRTDDFVNFVKGLYGSA
jgi:hypothetical protein